MLELRGRLVGGYFCGVDSFYFGLFFLLFPPPPPPPTPSVLAASRHSFVLFVFCPTSPGPVPPEQKGAGTKGGGTVKVWRYWWGTAVGG